jgi:hypothetical protein
VGRCRDLDHKAIAYLRRWRGGLGGPSPPRPPRAAGVGYDAIAHGMIPPGLRPAASPARPPVLILCDGRFGIRLTGKPAGLHVLHVLNDGLSLLRLRSRIGLGLLLRQLTRMHDDKPQLDLRHLALAVLHVHRAVHALAMPAARPFVLRPPRLLDQEGQRRLLASPRFKLLPDSTGARNQGH